MTPTLSAIKFGTSFGKAAALSAGLEKVTGRIVITMDADMQDDPQRTAPSPRAAGEWVRPGHRLQEGPP